MPFFQNIIPENIKGKSSDIEFENSVENHEEAIDVFKRATKRMLNVNIWHKLAGIISAEFTLTDAKGNKLDRLAALNDYIRVDIQGPGSTAGDGFDWVHIEALELHTNSGGEEESVGMRVRSCKQPGKDSNNVAHFFTSDATSTFIIHRYRNKVTSFYHGRNEVINKDNEKMLDSIRNVIMGGVAKAGVSEMQWKALIKGFLEIEV